MKEKIIFLIIGILVGAIITAGIFLIMNKINENNFIKERPEIGDFRGGMQEGNPAKMNKNYTQDENSTENLNQNQNNQLPPNEPEENINSDNSNSEKTKKKQNSNVI